MSKDTDLIAVDNQLYFLPVRMRVPLKFGLETSTSNPHLRYLRPGVHARAGPRRPHGRGLGGDPAGCPLGLAEHPPLRGAAHGASGSQHPAEPRLSNQKGRFLGAARAGLRDSRLGRNTAISPRSGRNAVSL
jgi:hypothetical protein